MSTAIIDAFRMPPEVMPPHDAVYEVNVTPFQACAVAMLFLDTAMKLSKAKELAEEGAMAEKYAFDEIESTKEFLSIYGSPAALSLGTDAVARLNMPSARLSMMELSVITCVCQIGVNILPNSDDWAECIASWLRGVRNQILEDHVVRTEVSA